MVSGALAEFRPAKNLKNHDVSLRSGSRRSGEAVDVDWKQFKTDLPEWMDSQLEHWQEEALAVDAKERQARA